MNILRISEPIWSGKMAKPTKFQKTVSSGFQDCVDTLFCKEDDRKVEVLAPDSDVCGLTEFLMVSENIHKLSCKKNLTISIPFLRNSNGRLAIDHSLFENIMVTLAVDSRFRTFAAYFRYKQAETDFAHPPCFFQTLRCSPNGDNLRGFECFFALRCPGARLADASGKWSLRQMAVYQKFDAARNQTRWIFLGISLSRSELGELIQEHLQTFPPHEAQEFYLHLILLEYVVSCWKVYLADLYDTVKDSSEEVLFKRRREDLTQFKNRPDLKQVKDSLVKLPLMIMSLAGTIKRLGAEANQYTVIPSASPQPQSFEYLLEEAELLQKRVDMLRDRVQDLTSFTHDKLNHLNSRYMMQVAESTKNDSAAMKYITIITVLFLPATFVATFFSMQLVNVGNGGLHISKQIWVYFAITIPLTIVTIFGWLCGMWREQKRQGSSDSQDLLPEDTLDIERGLSKKSLE